MAGAQQIVIYKPARAATHCRTLPAKLADSVDLKDGLLNNRVCTVKFPVVESFFLCNTTHTKVPLTRMDLEV